MKESEYVKLIVDNGHLPLLSDCGNNPKTKSNKKLGSPHSSERHNILRSRQQARMDSLNNDAKSAKEKLKVKVITVSNTKNDELSQKINQLSIDADSVLNIIAIKNTFYIWYEG